jgi:hypothetical protein
MRLNPQAKILLAISLSNIPHITDISGAELPHESLQVSTVHEEMKSIRAKRWKTAQ